MARIFISYSRVDVDFTDTLAERLRRTYGYENIWYDDNLAGGDLWWQEIIAKIAWCDIFVYLLSNESVTSPYCKAEFTEAQRLQKRVITVQIRDRTKIPDEMGHIHYVDMKAGVNDAEALVKLFAAINRQTEKLSKHRPKVLDKTPTPHPGFPTKKMVCSVKMLKHLL